MAIIKLLVEGGNMTPGPAVAQQLGPMGINIGQVISDINAATQEFKGVTLPVHLTIDPDTKEVSIKVLSPPTSELIKKELGIEKASSARLKQRVGNFAIEQVIAVAKAKHDSMLSNDFMATLKSVIGTCQALGILIENKETREIMQEINEGKFAEEISAKKTEIDPEKRKILDDYFATITAKQEEIKKAEDAEKAAEEEKKVEAEVETEKK
ncbi:50S ribosomal protein L11 [Candidatus Pacearchaeota archaeon]|nr:50S ribosomal protein L11 [Candidatus Pacearchaeota archaeon]